ncbi:MAG: N-methyl-L-tryptophan oxidase [Bdellovibrionales bacterium]|nr:N-methyl-L-tryptophan oxidase [Bdellovibrionales bacterium]
MNSYDVIVLGVGGMGSAACYALSKKGARVLGLEQFRIGHDRGSSHGQTRMIRRAYFEHPDYVPLLNRAYNLWDEIENSCEKTLFHRVGLIIYGASDSAVLAGVQRSASEHHIPIETLDPKEAAVFHSGLRPPAGFGAIFEPGAGFLLVEDSIEQMTALAVRSGAKILEETPILHWKPVGSGVEVRTASQTFHAKKLVIAAGAWAKGVLSELSLPLVAHRNLLHWFAAPDVYEYRKETPCFAFDTRHGFLYGFPKVDPLGIKIANHLPGPIISDPHQFSASVAKEEGTSPAELTPIKRCLSQSMPLVEMKITQQAACMYTMSPDENFILGTHPQYPQVSFVAGLSGHGFKFAPVIGEALCDLALQGRSDLPIAFLSYSRLTH